MHVLQDSLNLRMRLVFQCLYQIFYKYHVIQIVLELNQCPSTKNYFHQYL